MARVQQGEQKVVPGEQPSCWYCGDTYRVEHWTVNGHPSPLCRLHSATTRASLLLRACGKTTEADAFDDVVGLDTRPRFVTMVQPGDGRVT